MPRRNVALPGTTLWVVGTWPQHGHGTARSPAYRCRARRHSAGMRSADSGVALWRAPWRPAGQARASWRSNARPSGPGSRMPRLRVAHIHLPWAARMDWLRASPKPMPPALVVHKGWDRRALFISYTQATIMHGHRYAPRGCKMWCARPPCDSRAPSLSTNHAITVCTSLEASADSK